VKKYGLKGGNWIPCIDRGIYVSVDAGKSTKDKKPPECKIGMNRIAYIRKGGVK
jgi:hypothetical protein